MTVNDEGTDIAPKDIDKLFERYYRVEGKTMYTVAGFGIGLYLCAEIIRRHGGKIWVTSEPGKGSTFYLSLPCRKINFSNRFSNVGNCQCFLQYKFSNH